MSYCILSASLRLELPFQKLFHHTVLTSTRTTNTKLLFCKRILLEMIGQALGPAITSVRASLSGTTVPDRWDCILSSSLRLELPFQRLFHHTVPTTRALKISVRAGLSGTTVPDRWAPASTTQKRSGVKPQSTAWISKVLLNE